MDAYFGTVVSSGVLTTLVVQLIKYIVRKVARNDSLDLPTEFYAIGVPVINALMPFLMVVLGLTSDSPILTFSLVDVIRYIILTVVASAVSFFGYETALKPLIDYSKRLDK